MDEKAQEELMKAISGSGEIQNPVLYAEIAQGKELNESLDSLLVRFRGFSAPGYSQDQWLALLDKMKEFESQLVNFPILHFMYGYMARTALNAQLFDEAVMYANGGLKLALASDDAEGVRSMNAIRCDICCATDKWDLAAALYEEMHPGTTESSDRTYAMLCRNARAIDGPSDALCEKATPKSLRFVDTLEGKKEASIRLIMKSLHIKRAAAKKYVASAEERANIGESW
ncbi:hypothetical protein A3709_20325 [Halioglobus sp. HI00S01]|uniref:hypothetical protein n=1 Tax=Halioglobus sp. HI00S01 TaxID=1822214 RepID=UPI0007C2DA3D|nr:hypothetical protein [Halioglobus sp. HI00S01]KZX57960.1 hypothetical protein A3709_20325 [Halioglobus sp. HI00S01]